MQLLFCVAMLALPLAAWAQVIPPPLAEAEAVRLGLARSALSGLEHGTVRADAPAAELDRAIEYDLPTESTPQ